MQLLSEHLRRNPGHAVASDDKKNGFNSISREAIFAGLRRWYPELIPTVALWYKVPRRLFLFNEEARDGDGNVFMSSEGCAQGDPLGPFLFAIGYHWTLLEMQVRNPSALILAYLMTPTSRTRRGPRSRRCSRATSLLRSGAGWRATSASVRSGLPTPRRSRRCATTRA